ncbi:MAG: hypothetical protein LBR07_00975 [Puniceicoccales bacterium]|nr:hypothetical protein [Puniceicoccales bacterium]
MKNILFTRFCSCAAVGAAFALANAVAGAPAVLAQGGESTLFGVRIESGNERSRVLGQTAAEKAEQEAEQEAERAERATASASPAALPAASSDTASGTAANAVANTAAHVLAGTRWVIGKDESGASLSFGADGAFDYRIRAKTTRARWLPVTVGAVRNTAGSVRFILSRDKQTLTQVVNGRVFLWARE